MDISKITSRSNEKIKQFIHLSQSAALRRETGLFALEGARLCADAAQTGIEIKTAFFSPEALIKYEDYVQRITSVCRSSFEIPQELCAKMSDTKAPQGVFCICSIPAGLSEQSLDPNGVYIALENMQDPSNLGAVMRTAEAFGLSGVIVGGGCDVYNPKALRAAMGSSLRLSVLSTGNLPALLIFAAKKGMLTLASTPDSSAADITALKKQGGVICVIGNEGNGISEQVACACSTLVTIPMKGRAESLNAAAAAAVLMWELIK